MSKARDLANFSDVAPDIGRKNLIINGAMQVAQRGTSASGLTNGSTGYHTVDRFRYSEAGATTSQLTMSQDSDAPNGFGQSLKFAVTTTGSAAADDIVRCQTILEGQDLQGLAFGSADAKNITLSFWVKSSLTGTYSFYIYATDGNRVIGSTYTINSANTWEYKTITFPGDTAQAIANDNTASFYLGFVLSAGSNQTATDNTSWDAISNLSVAYGHAVDFCNTASATWQITGVQLEVGSVATPFEHRSYGEELALCQRYFYEFTDVNDGSEDVGIASCYNTNQLELAIQFPVQMRSTPSYTRVSTGTNFYAYGNNGNDGFAGFTSMGAASKNRCMIYTETADGFAGNTGQARRVRKQDSAARINFDAEL